MAKLNIGAVLKNLAQTASGTMQGQIAAEQELRTRRLQQQQLEEQHDRMVMDLIPKLRPEDQANVTQTLFQRSANRAAGRPSDFITDEMRPPGTGARFGGGWTPPIQEGTFSPLPPDLMAAQAQATAALPTTPQRPMVPMQGPLRPLQGPQMPLQQRPMVPSGPAGPSPAATAQAIGAMPTTGAIPTPYGQVPARAPAPARPPREIALPGYGKVQLRGVDPKEAQRLLKDIGDTWNRVNTQAFVKDPNTQAALRSYLSQKPTKPVDQWTEEDFQKAQGALQGLNDTAAFLGRGNAQFQMTMDQSEAKQLTADVGKLSTYRADNLQQELIRLKGRARGLMERGMVQVPSQLMAQLDDIGQMETALAEGTPEGKQRAGLILGLVRQELTPKPKDDDPYRRLDGLLGQAKRWGGVAPAAQQVYIRRLRQAAQDAGLDPSVIPDRIEEVMSEEDRERLGISKAQLGVAQQREKRLASEQEWRRGFDTRKEQRMKRKDEQDRQAKDGSLTKQESAQIAQWRNQRDGLEKRLLQLQEKGFTDIGIGGKNPLRDRAQELERLIEGKDKDIQGIIDRAKGRRAGGKRAMSGGKLETGAMINELANPNRPENRNAARTAPQRKWAIGNDGRLQMKQRMYNRYKREGHSDAEARKMAEEDMAAFRPAR